MERLGGILRLASYLALLLLVLAVLAALGESLAEPVWLLTLAVLAAVLMLGARLARRWLPGRTLLELDLQQGVVERMPDERLARLTMPRRIDLREVVQALDRAANDPRVVGLMLRIAPSGIGFAHAQEVADAIDRFRAAGKKAVAWCPTLGEGQSASAEYLLASACDEIHLQPGGDLSLIGFALHQPYARGLLDRLGVLPRIDSRERYKTARYPFTEHEMPAPARESLDAVVRSQIDQLCERIARHRNLTAEKVRELVDRAPLLAEEARDAGLIDGIAHRDELEQRLKRQRGTTPVAVHRYLDRAGRGDRRGTPVALIYGVGMISRGRGGRRRIPPATILGAEEIAEAFRTAIESKKIRAIVFRIDSPGGSAVASETIWRQVRRAREAGKPVIVSMSNLAGSGGYYIAAGADRILAQPGTLTGSIGVVSGKLVTRDAWAKAGVNWQGVHAGRHATIWSGREDFTESGWQKLQAALDSTYALFKRRVAEGRELTAEQVDAAAQGRVWTARAAKERGLIDELGGLRLAIDRARELAGLAPRQPVRLVTLPEPRRWLPVSLLPVPAEQTAWLEEIAERLEPIAPALAPLDPEQQGWLRMPMVGGSSQGVVVSCRE